MKQIRSQNIRSQNIHIGRTQSRLEFEIRLLHTCFGEEGDVNATDVDVLPALS